MAATGVSGLYRKTTFAPGPAGASAASFPVRSPAWSLRRTLALPSV